MKYKEQRDPIEQAQWSAKSTRPLESPAEQGEPVKPLELILQEPGSSSDRYPILEDRTGRGDKLPVKLEKKVFTRRQVLINGSMLLAGGITGGEVAPYIPRLIDLARSLENRKGNLEEKPAQEQQKDREEVALNYSRDLKSWGIDSGYNPKLVDLSTKHPDVGTPLDPIWVDPPVNGLKRVYGSLHFGDDTNLNVVLDGIDTQTPRIYLSLDGSLNFSHVRGQAMPEEGLPYVCEFDVAYAGGVRQKYAIFMYVPGGYNQGNGITRVAYYIASTRVGKVKLNGQIYPIALTNEKVDGLYSNLDGTYVWLDINRNGRIAYSFYADSSFFVDEIPYIVSSVERSGDSMRIKRAEYGEITGRIVDDSSKAPISLARIKVTKTNDLSKDRSGKGGLSGVYHLAILEGRQRGDLIIQADGYVPGLVNLQQLDNNRVTVVAGKQLKMDTIALQPVVASQLNGHLRLNVGDSYHFLAGKKGKEEEGDLYLQVDDYNQLAFYADHHFQNGIADLSDTAPDNLVEIVPPDTGYGTWDVVATVGYSYVARPRVGEEGHFIVFRVTHVEASSFIEMDFYYL